MLDSERNSTLTICDYDREAGTITICIPDCRSRNIGNVYPEGRRCNFHDVVGPLGRPSELVVEDMETLSREKSFLLQAAWEQLPAYPR